MQFKPVAVAALLGGVLALAAVGSAAARPDGYGHPPGPIAGPQGHPPGPPSRHRVRRHHARMLPPGIPYRDPSIDLRPRGRPDFLIHAYLPRFTEAPMYNEPPAHFPQR